MSTAGAGVDDDIVAWGFDKPSQRWDRAASAEGVRGCSVCRSEAWWEAISAAQGQGSRLGRLAKGRREEQVGGRRREYEVAYVTS